ncbi:hypothetical protein LDDCCGHA_4858 [Methylobacterium oxalidis]|nr:hypothetical protein LDDCCGHA_4858 [Methylobacterium oxalidis]
MAAAATMAGVPLLNGFLSKEMFFAETIETHNGSLLDDALPYIVVLALAGVGELLAQLADEDVDDLQLGLVHAAVEVVEEHLLRQGRALPEREEFQHLVLLAGEVHPRAGDLDGLLVEVDDEVARRDHRLGVALRAAHDGVDAGDELVLVEGLGQVVVGAEAETLHLVLDARHAGENQDRGLHLRDAKGAEHLVARHVGQVQVEEDDVVVVELAEIDALLTEVGGVGVEVLGLEHQLDAGRDRGIIFDKQHAHHGTSARRSSYSVKHTGLLTATRVALGRARSRSGLHAALSSLRSLIVVR